LHERKKSKEEYLIYLLCILLCCWATASLIKKTSKSQREKKESERELDGGFFEKEKIYILHVRMKKIRANGIYIVKCKALTKNKKNKIYI
jgi:hypothetical protein